ncbi:MAG: hypothetical protein JOZ78_15760 [Chroococcidiopsidaceae cyanobacterium CP_BM_ER_R8_30]|nr:hypothetical protein [Chroococcidiopsidaceae cyanobacterium CP_BM_ER_R8_30]
MKFTTSLISGLTVVTLAIAPLGFTPTAQASTISRSAYGSNGSASRSAAWGPHGAAQCASGVYYGGGFAGGCRSTYNGANGSYHGSHYNSYNSQTSNGYHSANRNGTYNDNSYGYNSQTNYSYSKGSGVSGSTTINTQNNGSYTCSLSTQSGCSK